MTQAERNLLLSVTSLLVAMAEDIGQVVDADNLRDLANAVQHEQQPLRPFAPQDAAP